MNYLEKNIKQYKKDLSDLIKIKTWLRDVEIYPTNEMKQSLDFMKSLADRDNMTSYVDPKGYYGYIEIGQGKELIGILGHLDVVPPGSSELWNSDPFTLTEKGNTWIGRGVQDDKGPVMLTYYLMKELNEQGNLNKRIRLIMGTDEENFWRGIEKYKNDGQEHVTYGITPDSSFPVTYLEKELIQYKILSKEKSDFSLTGGTAFNAVADFASLTQNNETKTFHGKSAHAMEPWSGDNAIFKAINKIDSEHNLIKFIKEKINNEVNGETLFDELIQDEDSPLTLTIGKIQIDDKQAYIGVDSRLPTTITADEYEEKIKEICSTYNLEYERFDYLPGVYFPKNSKIITDLIEVYRNKTNDNSEPISMGGATYARGMKNVVAFGPLLKESEITEHQPNERINIKEFIKAYDIYHELFIKWLTK